MSDSLVTDKTINADLLNDYSGKMIFLTLKLRRKSCFWLHWIVFLIALICTANFGSVEARDTYANYAVRIVAAPPEGIVIREDLEALLLQGANTHRSAKRHHALTIANPILQRAARAHAIDMAVGNFVGHTATTGQGFEQRMRALHPGVMVLSALAENAARERSAGPANATKIQKLMQQWIKSASHRRTLLSRTYFQVATGVVQKGDHLYAVQIFASPDVKSNMGFGGAGSAADGLY